MKHLPKYVVHGAIVKKHLIRHGYSNIPTLNDNWYFDTNKRIIVVEGA